MYLSFLLCFGKGKGLNVIFKKFIKAVLVYAEDLIVYLYGNSVHAVTEAESRRHGYLVLQTVFLDGIVHQLDNFVRTSDMARTAYAYVDLYHRLTPFVNGLYLFSNNLLYCRELAVRGSG